jgi:predicted amino acid-binding ACT domain protein
MYASSHYVNIIGISQKLMRTISFEAILVYLKKPNGGIVYLRIVLSPEEASLHG